MSADSGKERARDDQRSFALAFTAVLALASFQGPPEWRLRQPVSDTDKTRVIALAARLNIAHVATVTGELIHHPLACEALRIESVPAITGNRRTWQRVWVTNTEWRNSCRPASVDPTRVDTWVVTDRAGEVGAWRVQDRNGFVQIETPPKIPYADVRAIVRSLRTGSLINRLPQKSRGTMSRVLKMDAAAIHLIWNDQFDPSLYRVWFRGTNVVLLVAVRGTRVELRESMTEMS